MEELRFTPIEESVSFYTRNDFTLMNALLVGDEETLWDFAPVAYGDNLGILKEYEAGVRTIEGDYDELMDIVKECQHIAIRAGAPSVAAYVKVSYKPEGEVLTIEKKVTKHHR